MRVAVLGASGFVGRALVVALRTNGHEAILASLRDPREAAAAAANCDAVVNVAGEPINQRWNAKVKARIETSRSDAPRAFLNELVKHSRRPAAYVSASAIGYYGTSETATFDENSPPGNDFLAQVCVAWEYEAQRASEFGMRVAIVRSGIALGTNGGALKAMLQPFKLGLGGIIGSGKQWLSWIHIKDLVAVYLHAIERGEGPYNATAPNPVTNAELTRELSAALHRPAAIPTPIFALRAMLGEGANLLLEGQRVVPAHLEADGFEFRFRTLRTALSSLLGG